MYSSFKIDLNLSPEDPLRDSGEDPLKDEDPDEDSLRYVLVDVLGYSGEDLGEDFLRHSGEDSFQYYLCYLFVSLISDDFLVKLIFEDFLA